MHTSLFQGHNVFLSRKLVPPESFDSLHEVLKSNGASVFLCCDPSRNSPTDYHVISSMDHEMFEDLRVKGCNLIGPQCILSCAKERRVLPKQNYICCLAMDGTKFLASGFEKDEKAKIEKLITAMGGMLQSKVSPDISFVIVKNVLAAKYKWASTVLKKPIVSLNWLYQCWSEHRVVAHEPHRILPFTGLTICATRISVDERKQLERKILENGGQYSADLTKKCTHLISDLPEGDKYKVARKWGHIHIVTPKWAEQSILRRACLAEEFYPVLGGSNSTTSAKVELKGLNRLNMDIGSMQTVPSVMIGDQETTSQNFSSTFSYSSTHPRENCDVSKLQTKEGGNSDRGIAGDSESDSDLYLSNCRILLIGFQNAEMPKLVNMVRRGGGSRYMSFRDKLTHVIVGKLTEREKQEVRNHAAWGVIKVVNVTWLEDCDRERREVPVSSQHLISEISISKDPECSSRAEPESFVASTTISTGSVLEAMNCQEEESLKRSKIKLQSESNYKTCNLFEQSAKINHQNHLDSIDKEKKTAKLSLNAPIIYSQNKKVYNVFEGRVFQFSSSFPDDRMSEIIDWVVQGGGIMVDNHQKKAHFTIERHGLLEKPTDSSQTVVSSHWVRFCLEEGYMPDIGSHILFSPLICQIPFPGLSGLRFCVSQYEEKERMLLRNLCFVLGSKFTEKLSKRVTHLLCKFSNGPKYEAACNWGIEIVTADWITECIKQDKLVSPDHFRPKAVSIQDEEAGLCTTSQYPTQAKVMVSGYSSLQFPSQSQIWKDIESQAKDDDHLRVLGKKAKIPMLKNFDDNRCKEIAAGAVLSGYEMRSLNDKLEPPPPVPDVATAIEDLLEQSNKIQGMKSPSRGRNVCDETSFSPDRSVLGQSHASFDISSRWLSRAEKQPNFSHSNKQGENQRAYEAFSETQTDSQVVGYEEDLSGRQMIIDRVRSQNLA